MAKVKKFDMKGKGMKGFKALPNDTYPMKITSSEIKDTKAGDGEMTILKWSVIDGPFKGRTYLDRLNLDNPSVQAVEISQDRFASIHEALGFDKIVKNTDELHDIPCLVTLITKSSKGYDDSNEASKYESFKKGKKDKSKDSSEPWKDDEVKKEKKEKKDKKDKKKNK